MEVESEIEALFLAKLSRYLSTETKLSSQVEFKTIGGLFRVDFLIEAPCGEIIVIECDGKDFHDDIYDSWRDALILSTKKVNYIYRFRGKDIYTYRYDPYYYLYRFHPNIFTESAIDDICYYSKQEKLYDNDFPDRPCSLTRHHDARVTDLKSCVTELPSFCDEEDEDVFDNFNDSYWDHYSQITARVGVNKRGLKTWGGEYFEFSKNSGLGNIHEIIRLYNDQNALK